VRRRRGPLATGSVRAAGAVLVAAALLAAGSVDAAAPASAGTTVSAVRIIGGPGHAAHYGWGQDTIPPGFPNAGDVLSTDYLNYRVLQFAPDGSRRRVAIGNDRTHWSPYDVAVNPVSGTIAIGDVDNGGRVGIYGMDGRFLRSCAASWLYPGWLDYDASGRLAVADSRGNTITMVDDATCRVLFRFADTGGRAQVRTPRGLDFAPDGTLWVNDTNNGRVAHYSVGPSSASLLGALPVRGGDNRGLLVNPDNDLLYVVNAGSSLVDVYDQTGTRRFSFGGRGTALGKFSDGGRGITRDGAGNVWVGDMPGFRTQKFTPTGRVVLAAPNPPSPPPPGGFNQPGGVGVDDDGTVYVADTFNWRVQRFDPTGRFVGQFGSRLLLNYARGLAVDRREGTLIVGNTDAQQVDKYTVDGGRLWSVPGVKSFSVAVDQRDGTVYGAQYLANKVTVLSADGRVLREFGAGLLDDPRGIAVDPSDRSVWVSNQGSGQIVHFSRAGAPLGSFPSGAVRSADLEVDADTVYLADKLGDRLRLFAKTGEPRGTFGATGTGLGRFRGPQGMDLLGDRLYVTESGGERVQELRVTKD
jgi:tripartite motif-containing protein 71